ncbi:hypothetical protein CVM39_11580 [Pseudooceanicola antarcticus]|uniref:Uncharacterized protein n=1 Tax=Pseudooceanicola antarcticus TaxID=1247613 RepID=A0ABX4MPL0_9RHOB|nr:hypothetical protein CVM39_11580 [Pseudooceanicola antarcticus]
MSAQLLISCDAFAALMIAPHRAATPARITAPTDEERACDRQPAHTSRAKGWPAKREDAA